MATIPGPPALIPRCGFCNQINRDFLICDGCKVMLYCGREHQAAHRSDHESICDRISSGRIAAELEAQEPPDSPYYDDGMPFNPFWGSLGMVSGIHHSGNYLRLLRDLVNDLRQIDTYHSAVAQLSHLMDMVLLDWHEDYDSWGRTSALLLRTQQDQKCYDFVAWYAMMQEENQCGIYIKCDFYEFGTENALDPVESLLHDDFYDYSHWIALTLLKVKVLIEVIALRDSAAACQGLPGELHLEIQKQIASSEITAKFADTASHLDLRRLVFRLARQVMQVYRLVEKQNPFFWPALLSPDRDIPTLTDQYPEDRAADEDIPRKDQYNRNRPRDKLEESRFLVRDNYEPWMETPGALEVIGNIFTDNGAAT